MAKLADAPSPGNPAEGFTAIRLWDSALARAVDTLSSETYGIAPAALMESAGREVARVAMAAAGKEALYLVLAGTGNNGGDALVAARWLAEGGAEVHSFLVPKDRNAAAALQGLCAAQVKTLVALDLAPLPWTPGALGKCVSAIQPPGRKVVVVDGLLGTGFKGTLDPQGPMALALREASLLASAHVVAVDIPSGVGPDGGGASDQALLPAQSTVTFGERKPAHVLAPARDASGSVFTFDVGFPKAAVRAAIKAADASLAPSFAYVERSSLLKIDPWAALPPSAHKYDRGHVLVLGGSAGKTGAPLLAALAALRTGAGWATVAMPSTALATLAGDIPRELTFEALFAEGAATVDATLLANYLKERRVRAVVAGPGTMTTPLTRDVIAVLVAFSATGGTVVLDAGATHGILPLLSAVKAQAERWLLTPHPGEWARLGPPFAENPLTLDGLKATKVEAVRAGVTLLYKHATPVLVTGSPNSQAIGYVMDAGSIALARAGSGDVYAGIAGAHGAIGVDAVTTALRAQALLGNAASQAADTVGLHAVLASDITRHLGQAGASTLRGWEIRELGRHEP